MDKKYLIIIGAVAGLTIIGLVAFWIFGRPAPSSTTETADGGAFPPGGERIPGQITPIGLTPPPPTIQPGQQKPLTQISDKAISGAIYAEKIMEDKTKTGIVRYFEKATGHIYDYDYQKKTSVRVSNTTILGIFDVFWSTGGDKAAFRYAEKNENNINDTIRNFSLSSIGTASTTGIFLLSSISAIASSPKEEKIFYLAPFENNFIGITANFEDKKQKQIFTTSFGEFLADWPSERAIILTTRPSANTEGYLYKLDAISGSFERILFGIKGLTALWSPDDEFILYSYSGYKNLKNSLYNIKEKKAASFSLMTLPEKCAWSKIRKGIIYCAIPLALPPADYPDDWYQGIISFSDRVWKIDIVNGATEIISSETDFPLDIINPFFDKNENYLFFQNKYDNTLWSLQLSS